ncbi:MAG: BMP family ABC transporter substrate-binding protein [Mycoplasmoidaceae bacterium]
MTKKLKRIIKTVSYSLLGAFVLSSVIGFSVASSSTNKSNLFAEIIVSDNPSVLADQSFSEYTFNGYQKFVQSKGYDDLDARASTYKESAGLWRRPGTTNLDREITFKGSFYNGKDLIIAPGFNHATPINNVLMDRNYDDKGFLLLDSNIGSWDSPLEARNATTITFRMEQAGFQTGLAAGEFLFVNRDIFGAGTGEDAKLKLAGYVGMAFPSTMDFLIGLQKGMVAWNALNSTREGYKAVEWVTLGKNPNNYGVGSFGVGDGRQMASSLINTHKADMIMPIAGPQTLDVIQEIVQAGRPVAVIGVDSPQEGIVSLNKEMPGLPKDVKIKNPDGTESENQNIIQFSAEKKLDVAVFGILNSIFNTDAPNEALNGFSGFGYHNIAALGENGEGAVGISENGKKYFTWGFFSGDMQTPGSDTLKHTYEDAISGLPTNATWKQLIVDDTPGAVSYIQMWNTSSGLPATDQLVEFDGIRRFSGLKSGVESFAPMVDGKADRLDGSKWKIVR